MYYLIGLYIDIMFLSMMFLSMMFYVLGVWHGGKYIAKCSPLLEFLMDTFLWTQVIQFCTKVSEKIQYIYGIAIYLPR